MKTKKIQKGFTMIELLMYIVVFSIIIVILYNFLINFFNINILSKNYYNYVTSKFLFTKTLREEIKNSKAIKKIDAISFKLVTKEDLEIIYRLTDGKILRNSEEIINNIEDITYTIKNNKEITIEITYILETEEKIKEKYFELTEEK
jgi:prepilin-type N-terminal cleavage/methylation domain-containing protein